LTADARGEKYSIGRRCTQMHADGFIVKKKENEPLQLTESFEQYFFKQKARVICVNLRSSVAINNGLEVRYAQSTQY